MRYAQHHFVPQFYLRRFTDNSGKVHVYDKDADKVFSTSPRNICTERGFYALPELYPDPLEMERQFSEIEQHASMITKEWIQKMNFDVSFDDPMVRIETSESVRDSMALYIATQMTRTSEARTILIQGISGLDAQSINTEIKRDIHTDFLWNNPTVYDA